MQVLDINSVNLYNGSICYLITEPNNKQYCTTKLELKHIRITPSGQVNIVANNNGIESIYKNVGIYKKDFIQSYNLINIGSNFPLRDLKIKNEFKPINRVLLATELQIHFNNTTKIPRHYLFVDYKTIECKLYSNAEPYFGAYKNYMISLFGDIEFLPLLKSQTLVQYAETIS